MPHHTEAMPASVPPPDRRDLGRPLEHRERIAFQLELARRMSNLTEFGVSPIDIRDPAALAQLHATMESLGTEARAAADERMLTWAEGHMDTFRAIVDAESEDGALIRRLIRTEPESALDRVAALLRQRLH